MYMHLHVYTYKCIYIYILWYINIDNYIKYVHIYIYIYSFMASVALQIPGQLIIVFIGTGFVDPEVRNIWTHGHCHQISWWIQSARSYLGLVPKCPGWLCQRLAPLCRDSAPPNTSEHLRTLGFSPHSPYIGIWLALGNKVALILNFWTSGCRYS